MSDFSAVILPHDVAERRAVVITPPERLKEVRAYLPDNYAAYVDGNGLMIIVGKDVAGWTLDGYVIPRLASGLTIAVEKAEVI